MKIKLSTSFGLWQQFLSFLFTATFEDFSYIHPVCFSRLNNTSDFSFPLQVMFSKPSIALAPLLGIFQADLHLSWNALFQTGLSAPAAMWDQKGYFIFFTYASTVYTSQHGVWVFGNILILPTHVYFVPPASTLRSGCFVIHLPSCCPHLTKLHSCFRPFLHISLRSSWF